MNFINGHIYHIYNRGNNKQLIFFKDENYRYFLRKVKSNMLPLTDILAYCLMPNHFHFLVVVKEGLTRQTTDHKANTPGTNSSDHFTLAGAQISGQTNDKHPLVGKIAHLLSSYTRAINVQEKRTGSLFQKKTKAKDISEGELAKQVRGLHPMQSFYSLNCFHYIHQNPLKTGLVKRMEDWKFSSFNELLGRNNAGIVNLRLAHEIIGFDKKDFYEQSYIILEGKELEGIW